MMCRKCPLSLMYEGINGTSGLMKWSTNCEIRSVGHSFADTIGLPGGGILHLCILGRKYICAVRGLLCTRYCAVVLSISPDVTILLTMLEIISLCLWVRSVLTGL